MENLCAIQGCVDNKATHNVMGCESGDEADSASLCTARLMCDLCLPGCLSWMARKGTEWEV